jgi:hypothetical protein
MACLQRGDSTAAADDDDLILMLTSRLSLALLDSSANRDDHETANNAFKEGAENNVDGTTWENRRCAGVQVSCQWA